MRKCLLLMICAAAMLLTSCAASFGENRFGSRLVENTQPTKTEQLAWDSRFVDYFRPSERILELTAGAVQNINQDFVCGDYTIHIAQVLGDAKTIYIAADIVYPAGADLEEWSKYQLVDGIFGYDEVKELSAREIEEQYKFKGSSGGGGWHTCSTNYEENSVSYIFSFHRDASRFSTDGLSLLLYDEKVNAVASWKPEFNSRMMEWQLLNAEGHVVGRVDLSYFALNAELYSPKQNLIETVVFIQQDGEIFRARGSSGGGSTSSMEGELRNDQHTRQFSDMLPLEDIKTLRVDNYILEVNP